MTPAADEPAAPSHPPAPKPAPEPPARAPMAQPPGEIGGPRGPEPTRFGDWERDGRCIDF